MQEETIRHGCKNEGRWGENLGQSVLQLSSTRGKQRSASDTRILPPS